MNQTTQPYTEIKTLSCRYLAWVPMHTINCTECGLRYIYIFSIIINLKTARNRTKYMNRMASHQNHIPNSAMGSLQPCLEFHFGCTRVENFKHAHK